jgi:surface protein
MFSGALSFNRDLGGWDVSNVTDMVEMFKQSGLNTCNYDNTLIGWSTLDLTPNLTLGASGINYCDSETERQSILNNFGWTINGDELSCTDECLVCAINDSNIQAAATLWSNNPTAAEAIYGNISDWNTSCVTNMSVLFQNQSNFNDDISQWDVSNVIDMSLMFTGVTSFNQDIGDWDVSNVTSMYLMFAGAATFNQDIGDWDVSNVTVMESMFNAAFSFNQSLGEWDVSNVFNMIGMFNAAGLNTCNYDNTLIGWSTLDLTPNVTLSSFANYCNSESERQSIIDNFGWTIYDDGLNCSEPCITTANFSASVTEVCESEDVQFTDASSDNVTAWLWTFEGGTPATSTEQNPLVSYDAPGNYDVTLEVTAGAGSNQVVYEDLITVIGIPTAEFEVTIEDLEYSFVYTGVNGDEFNWDFGDGNSSTEVNPVHTYDDNGIYTVILVVSNACGNDFITKQIDITSSISELNTITDLRIFPNPTNKLFHVEMTLSESIDLQIEVMDIHGRIVHKESMNNLSGKVSKSIDLSDEPAGTYLLRLINGEQVKNKKIVLQK